MGRRARLGYPPRTPTRPDSLTSAIPLLMNNTISHWMAWEGGVDLVALTRPGLDLPNIIIHVARLVHTPVGSAPAGMLFWQPDPAAPPAVMGFVCPVPSIGAYFGPHIFAGTPFEHAPVLPAEIAIEQEADAVGARIAVGGHEFRTRLSGLKPTMLVLRPPTVATPFTQQGVEAAAAQAELWVDNQPVTVVVPPVGLSGGPAAVSAPCGLYAR